MSAQNAAAAAPKTRLVPAAQSIICDLLAAGDFWSGAGSAACQQFIIELGRNFQLSYEQANAHGVKVQTAGSNMVSTDSAGLQLGLTALSGAVTIQVT